MSASEEEAQQRLWWRLRWLSSIQAFSDAETQQRRWLDPAEANPAYSYVECMCVYFDDVLFGDKDYTTRIEQKSVTEAEVAAVANFHALAAAYENPNGDEWDNSAILADPKWQEVVHAAQHAKQRLLPLLSREEERLALTQPERWVQEGQTFRSLGAGGTITRLRAPE
jgi:hypothetical protein